MDFYQILGISPDSDEKQIKSAYKKLAKKYHPDAGGDQDIFYQVSQAYQTLIDPIAKQDYDFYNGFSDFYVNREQTYYENIKNPDIILSHTISIEDMITGKTIDISYRLSSEDIETVTINIPAGIKHGDTLRVQNAGDNYVEDNPRGDLLVKIKVKKKNNFIRDDDNLITTHLTNALDLVTGCVIVCEIPHYGKVEIDIPHGTQPGTIFSVPGYGFPNINTGKTGSLYVKVSVFIPRIDNQGLIEQLKLIKHHAEKDTHSGSKQRTTSGI